MFENILGRLAFRYPDIWIKYYSLRPVLLAC